MQSTTESYDCMLHDKKFEKCYTKLGKSSSEFKKQHNNKGTTVFTFAAFDW